MLAEWPINGGGVQALKGMAAAAAAAKLSAWQFPSECLQRPCSKSTRSMPRLARSLTAAEETLLSFSSSPGAGEKVHPHRCPLQLLIGQREVARGPRVPPPPRHPHVFSNLSNCLLGILHRPASPGGLPHGLPPKDMRQALLPLNLW